MARITFKDFTETFISFFRNDNTAARTYTFQDRNGTMADDTDLALKVDKSTTVNGNALSGNITITKTDISLGNVDNTSDANKPVSSAQQTALDAKANITSVVGTQDIWIGAGAMWVRSTSGCAPLAKSEMTTSLFNIVTLDFDQATQEFAQFAVSLPRNWDRGTVTAKVYWTASSSSGGVVWGISGGAYSNDDALTVALGTAQTSTDTLLATNDLHVSPDTAAITLAGSPADADFLAFQISRNPSDGSDTLAADAKLLGVVLTITTDAAIAS